MLSLWTSFLPVKNRIARVAGVGKRSEKIFYEHYLHNSWRMLFFRGKTVKNAATGQPPSFLFPLLPLYRQNYHEPHNNKILHMPACSISFILALWLVTYPVMQKQFKYKRVSLFLKEKQGRLKLYKALHYQPSCSLAGASSGVNAMFDLSSSVTIVC